MVKMPNKKKAKRIIADPQAYSQEELYIALARVRLGPKKCKVIILQMEGEATPEKPRERLMRMLPLGSRELGMCLQFARIDGSTFCDLRLVWWDAEMTVSNIEEQPLWGDDIVPADASPMDRDAFWAAWKVVVLELLEAKPEDVLPVDLFQEGSKSPWRLKGRTAEDFERALRAKSRLGKWL